MYRIVHVVGRNGKTYEVPMTAKQAAFYLRLTEFRAAADPAVRFDDVVIEKREKELLHPTPGAR